MTVTAELTAEGTRRTVDVGDVTLAYHDVGEGPPVVLLHGFPKGAFRQSRGGRCP